MGAQVSKTEISSETYILLEVLEQLARALSKLGFKALPYNLSHVKKAAQMDPDQIAQMTLTAKAYLQSVLEAPEFKDSKTFQIDLLKQTLNKLGLSPYDDFFDQIEGDDVIEIHMLEEGIQVYRSFSFFQFCSFELFDLLAFKWFELYDRPRKSSQDIQSKVAELMNTVKRTVSLHDWEKHVVKERKESPLLVELSFKFISPLYSLETGQTVAALTNKCCRAISADLVDESKVIVLG